MILGFLLLTSGGKYDNIFLHKQKGEKKVDYFEKDISKLHILKNAFYVTLVSGLTLVSTFVMTVCGFGIGKLDKLGTESMKKDAIVEIMGTDEYKSVTDQMKEEYAKELADGKITQGQYEAKIAYLSSDSFMERVLNSEKIKQYNEKLRRIKEGEENIKVVAPISAATGGALLAGAYGFSKKREQIKRRWFSEEEGRGL